MIKQQLKVMMTALIILMAGISINAQAQFTDGGPQPGDVYKEYVLTFSQGKKTWRVTDPNASNPGSPGNSPSDYLPNVVHSFSIDDFTNVSRAEVVIDLWGGHVGTTGKKIKFNNNSWITVPELNTTPTSGQCYAQQLNYTIPIPVSHLKSGSNSLTGTSGGQTCYNFRWGQWGWYGVVIRVYYSTSKGHTTGQITSPSAGSSISDNPIIRVSPNGGVSKIDILAKYDGYDSDGDGYFNEWGGDYHRTSWSDVIDLNNHVGTITSSPYQTTWDTEWVPDQNPGAISFIARIKNSAGYYYVTNEVKNVTLQRTNHSVRLYKPQGVPEKFWVRNGETKSSSVNISSLSSATQATVHVRTWNGNETGENFSTKVNGSNIGKYGLDHFYSYDKVNVPINSLKTGSNSITFNATTTHHGIEILWPGPAIIIKYGTAPPPPTGTAPTITQQPVNKTVTEGQTTSFSVAATGSSPLAYQWKKGNNNISGANSATYTTPVLSLSDNGSIYSCVVSNSYGTETSNGATLTVNADTGGGGGGGGGGTTTKIEIENNYTKISDVGSKGAIQVKSFSINSNGKAVSIPDTGDKIGVNFNISETGTYKLRVWLRSGNATNPFSYFNSNYTYLFDLTGLGTVNFVGNTSSVMGPYSAWGGSHWGFMEADVNFTTTGNKTLGIQSKYIYQAVDFLEIIGGGSSGGGTAPSITQHPSNITVIAGQSATFTVVATGSTPLSYQWKKGSTNISGANQASYTTPALTTSDNGNTYSCVVSNGSGSATSNTATVTVNSSGGGTTTKIEIENNYVKISDVGTNGAIMVKSFPNNSNGKGVAIQDKGDKIGVNFNIPSAGSYKIRVWLRSGNSTNKTSYFKSGYSYLFDLTGLGNVSFAGVPSSVLGPFSDWGGSHWGFMEATVNFTTAGNKVLGIKAEYVWQAVDYIEIVSLSSGARIADSEAAGLERFGYTAEEFNVYPNPLNDSRILTLQLDNSFVKENINIRIFNMHGASLFAQELFLDDSYDKIELDLSNALNKHGIYFLNISDNTGNSRIIKLLYQ